MVEYKNRRERDGDLERESNGGGVRKKKMECGSVVGDMKLKY